MKNNRKNRNTRSLDLNKKSISKLNEEAVNGGKAECSQLIRETEVFCATKELVCLTNGACKS